LGGYNSFKTAQELAPFAVVPGGKQSSAVPTRRLALTI
jgi:hypothetical protein